MAIVLGIDYGIKRTGIAVTDPYESVASPHTTVNTKYLFDFLVDYCENNKVEKIVVGWPKKPDGELSETARPIDCFVSELKIKLPFVSVVNYPEIFTTKMAKDTLLNSGLKRKKRRDKSVLDKISACLILSSYLDSQRLTKFNSR